MSDISASLPSPMSRGGHVRSILTLGLPLVGSHLAQFAITLTDAIMLGWYDIGALAGEVLGGSLWFVMFLFGSGFAFAVMPMVARAQSAGEPAQVRRVTRMGLWVSIAFAMLAVPLLLVSEIWLVWLGQDPAVADMASRYLGILAWGLFPALGVMVLKSFLAALERTRVVLWITLIAVAVNVVVNYALIFGNWGMPELGIEGAAIASLCVHCVSLAATIAYTRIAQPEHELFTRFWRPDIEALGRVFRLGWPIGLTNLAEVGLFAASSLMMGWLGPVALAAHGIALQISSATFMVQLGLSNAATVRAGQASGRDDAQHLRRGAAMVALLSMVIAVLTVAVFLLLPEQMIGLFLDPDDPVRGVVISTGVVLLAAAALFQVVDAAQVIALGLLRGIQDTKVPMVIAIISYWGLGAPLSYVLGFVLGWGGVGVWLGLAAGLGLAGVLLTLRFLRRAGDM